MNKNGPTYGFIGLGAQGGPMAQRLVSAGLRPWLWARRPEVTDEYRGADARIAATAAELGAACDVIGLCLFDELGIEALLFGPDGLMERVRPWTILAVHSTVAPAFVVGLAERVAPSGVGVVDAPVSGGGGAAEARRLLVMVGGEEADLVACRPMFDTYAGQVLHVGPVGAGQATKLVNNSLMTAFTGLVYDAFAMGRFLGLDEQVLGAVLANGSAATPAVGIYLEYGPEQLAVLGWPALHKDVGLAGDVLDGSVLADGLLMRTAHRAVDDLGRIYASAVEATGAHEASGGSTSGTA